MPFYANYINNIQLEINRWVDIAKTRAVAVADYDEYSKQPTSGDSTRNGSH